MDNQERQQSDHRSETQRLLDLEEIFNSPGWVWFQEILDRVYRNSDNLVHNVNSPGREIYVGKCMAISEVNKAIEQIKNEAEKGKTDAVDS